jgi:hypothetical protein
MEIIACKMKYFDTLAPSLASERILAVAINVHSKQIVLLMLFHENEKRIDKWLSMEDMLIFLMITSGIHRRRMIQQRDP